MLFREKVDIVALENSARFDLLHSQCQSIVTALASAQNTISQEMAGQTQKIELVLSEEIRVQTKAISQMMSRLDSESSSVGKTKKDFQVQVSEVEARLITQRAVLKSLSFSTMGNRREEVSRTYPETCAWIFQTPREQAENETHHRSNFSHWLEHGNGIYWISGKVASGKSTLMSYIVKEPRTSAFLKNWARPLNPTVAAFFFWNSGEIEQRPQSGLLRTVLFEVLRQHPSLIPICLPLEWSRSYSESAEIFGTKDTDKFARYSWTYEGLLKAFGILLSQTTLRLKLCLFIDGLDEYEGSYDDIIQMVMSVSSPDVKICVSSRPLLAFEDAFGSVHSLRVQDLTYSDIQHYVSQRLSSHQRYQQVLQESPLQAPQLVEDIVIKADGVFLWVKLVVESLLSGFGNRDSIRDLRRRLALLPGDLEQLYSHMLKSIPEFYKAQTSQYFQLVKAARLQNNSHKSALDNSEPLTLIELSLAIEEDHELTITAPIRSLGYKNSIARCELTHARLQVRCLGLLEVHRSRKSKPTDQKLDPFSRIQYMHRTARDFIESRSMWANLISLQNDESFNPYLSLLKCSILQLKWTLYSAQSPKFVFYSALSHAKVLEDQTGNDNVELLDKLHRTMKTKIIAIDYISFTDVAVENGLSVYAREKRKQVSGTEGDSTVASEPFNEDEENNKAVSPSEGWRSWFLILRR